jgi:hypothetical protein
VAEVLTAEPDQLRIWAREVANLQHQVIGEVDAQDGRSAVGDRPLVSEQWTSVPIRSRADSVDAPRCRRHLFAALRVEQGDPGGLERHYPAQRLQHRGGRSSMLADPAAILDRDL